MASTARALWTWMLAAAVVTAPCANAFEAEAPVLVSHTPAGTPTQGGVCGGPVLSRDSRFTSFSCFAFDIIPGEPGVGDAMLHDERTGSIIGLSYADTGEWGDCHGAEIGTCSSYALDIASDGSEVVLDSGAPLAEGSPSPIGYSGVSNVFLRNTVVGTTEWLTPPPSAWGLGDTTGRDASVERQEILISSSLNYAGDPDYDGSVYELFVLNWRTGDVERVTATPDGRRSNGYSTSGRFSPDGRFVVFYSNASNITDDNPQHLYNLFLRDRLLKTTRRLTFPWHGGEFSSQPDILPPVGITADNRHIVFSAVGARFTEDDKPPYGGVYEIDLQEGATRKIPRTTSGALPNAPVGQPALSANGRYLAFLSSATNLTEAPSPVPAVFVQDRWTGKIINVSAALGDPPDPLTGVAISADGSKVAFEWPHWNAVYPTLLDDRQVYAVRLHADPPPSPSPVVAVPTASRLMLLVLAGLLAGAAGVFVRLQRVRE